eukprot:12476117-Alexandrium_andersonii.AAC.1
MLPLSPGCMSDSALAMLLFRAPQMDELRARSQLLSVPSTLANVWAIMSVDVKEPMDFEAALWRALESVLGNLPLELVAFGLFGGLPAS